MAAFLFLEVGEGVHAPRTSFIKSWWGGQLARRVLQVRLPRARRPRHHQDALLSERF